MHTRLRSTPDQSSASRVKVLWLCTPLESRYGVMNIIRGWASRFDYDQFDVTLAFYSPNPEEVRRRLSNFPRLRVEFMPELCSLRLLFVPALRALLTRMQRERYDIVHTVFVQSDILGTIAARLTGVPVVVSSVMGYLVVPLGGAVWKTPIYKAAYGIVRGKIDRVTAITRTTGRQLVEDFGVAADKIHVLYSGIDLTERPRPPRTSGSFLIGSVGQLIPQKGVETVVRAIPKIAQKIANVRLVIAGEGPERPRLERMAESLGVTDHVEFIGFTEDVPALMARLDAFVFSAFPTYDGLPRVILEAMLQRTPVVAARTDPIEEVVVEGETGWLYEPGDAEGLAVAVERIRAKGASAALIVERAYQQVLKFSIEKEVEQLQKSYCILLNGKVGLPAA